MKVNDKDTLESILDRYTLETILDVLAQICHEKSDHVLSTWQNKTLSKKWLVAGIKLDHVKISKPISNISAINNKL